MPLKDPFVIGALCPVMLDAVFWWCAFVALAGSYALIGIALVKGSWSKPQRPEAELSGEATLMMWHFGQA